MKPHIYLNSYIPSAGVMRRGMVLDGISWQLMKVYIRKFPMSWISL